MMGLIRSSSVGDNMHTAPASPQAKGVEEECASAASGAEELECGEAGKLRGWDRLERWEAGTGWKTGTSVHHSPFTVDVYRPPKDWPVRKAIPPSTHLILPDTNIRGLKAASSLREKQSK